MTIPTRILSRPHGLAVSTVGLGCTGMSEFCGATRHDDREIATIHRAIELGVSFLDSSDMYGLGANEELVGRAIAVHCDQVVVATKFGIVRQASDPLRRSLNGRPVIATKTWPTRTARHPRVPTRGSGTGENGELGPGSVRSRRRRRHGARPPAAFTDWRNRE